MNRDQEHTDAGRDAPPPTVASAAGNWLRDFGVFLREHAAWWLVPLVLAIGAVVLLAWLTREPARPPTYPLF